MEKCEEVGSRVKQCELEEWMINNKSAILGVCETSSSGEEYEYTFCYVYFRCEGVDERDNGLLLE